MALIHIAIQGSKLSQKKAAEKLGISEQYLADVLGGRRRVSAQIAVRLEMAWGYPAVNFLYPQIQADVEKARAAIKIEKRKSNDSKGGE